MLITKISYECTCDIIGFHFPLMYGFIRINIDNIGLISVEFLINQFDIVSVHIYWIGTSLATYHTEGTLAGENHQDSR